MASGHVNRTNRGRAHGRTDQYCTREESPCQLGAVHTWPLATNFSLGPHVSFRGEAEVGRAAEPAASVENGPSSDMRVLPCGDHGLAVC
jgi:hypothetical protein